jgi:uncharacterized protein (DUF849 family)
LTGERVHKAELFKETIRIIRAESDLIINVTTGVGPDTPLSERISVIPELSADPRVKPEMASLNCGSLNFGMLNRKTREFILNDVRQPVTAYHFADTMKVRGIDSRSTMQV